MTLHARHVLLLAALAACGPGSGDESPGTDTTSTGGDSMSSNPSDPSMSTLPSDPTLPPDPTATTVQPTTSPPTTEPPPTTLPPDPTTTTSPTTPTFPTTVSTVTTEVTFTDFTDFTFSDTEFTTFDPSDTETVFIVRLDQPLAECDIFAENCPIGQKCMPFADQGESTWNNLKCVPIAPNPAQPGEPCFVEGNGVSGIDNCDIHGLCFDVDPDTLEGTCVAMCTGDEDNPICPPGSACTILNGGVLVLCLPICDPLVVQSCPPGDVCVNSGEQFQCVFDASGDEGQQFDVCEFANACDPGHVCVDSDGVPGCNQQEPSCCSTFCNLTQPSLCPPQTACVPFFDQPPPGLEDVGVCFAP